MFRKFIERPVLSTVISIIIVILGVLGIATLPVSQYPEIAPPTVSVNANYMGANADVVLKSVVVPLEEQINGVEGMTYISSSATNDGNASITVNFKQGVNPDIAAVNVQNRVSRANSLLPKEVTQAGVTVLKKQSSNVLIFTLVSDNPNYDQTFLQNYGNINIIPRIKRVNGVGDASVFGSKDYSIRIWLDPQKMAAYGLVPSDVNAVLAEQNIEAAPGSIGDQADQSFEYTLKYKGRLTTIPEFENIVLKGGITGQVLKLKDVAKIELGAQSYSGKSFTDGKQSIGIAISQTAGSNAQEVIKGCLSVLEESSKTFPQGISYEVLVNANEFLDASIEKVIHTLFEAFILVFIVVFVFLQDWRSTLIPAISVPVAIVGTFFFLSLFGFTINLLTLFALILAVGIVVDDAIVVVEAVHVKLEEGEKSPRRAAISAMNEISAAIISITLVMSAVFIPVSFITGSAGVFYKQFGLTLAISIVLSAVNALTLSPALCAIFLKPHAEGEHHERKKNFMQRFFTNFNTAFTATTMKYTKGVSFLIRRKWIALGGLLAFTGLFAWLMVSTPKAFVPNEDMGTVFADIALPLGASQKRTEAVMNQVEAKIKSLPEVSHILKISGRGMISGVGSNYGMIIVKLKPWAQRKLKGESQDAFVGKLYGMNADLKDAKAIFFGSPTLQGFGMSDGFEMQLQDQKGGTINDLNKVTTDFIDALNKRPEIQSAYTSFNPNFPQYLIDVDVATVKNAGYSVSDVLSVIQGYFGGVYASNVNLFGKQYRVIYQAPPGDRDDIASFDKMMVRSQDGSMAPVSRFITLKKVYGPQSISRFNLFTAVKVNGTPNPGYSSGDAINAVEEVAAQVLPTGYGYEFSGLTREEMAAGSQTGIIFALCCIFVYFLLCAQYESYMLPFAVMLSLPFGLAGAIFFTWITGSSNNIYTQISLIMLIGLLAKNAILIVEFAHAARLKGMSIGKAALRGAQQRLRPILMTSFAFIFGLVPLATAAGAGAVGNQAIGIAAIGGMLFGTIFGVMVIPVLYVIFQYLHEKVSVKNELSADVPKLTD
ncbi:efflux RND transporter permease subunit [Elizabethkingia sp. JS20170427COW]|uniref:efflux RND transporter permease subunit n=1 Tax=Elizabethkingia sp. JS20170427COW TaxID=2583851 RepID=UPI001110F645|nr:efflux RND transporter permease subunit [Elizabethkingia sp. JS20170427COW]QCX54033.1 efflux RND transporter permease subunit [Elizabethkingia sp. JS20170427COW]